MKTKNILKVFILVYFIMQFELSKYIYEGQLWFKIMIIIVPVAYIITYIFAMIKSNKEIKDYLSIIFGIVIVIFNFILFILH